MTTIYTVESAGDKTCRHRANTASHAAELHVRLHIAAGAEAKPLPGWQNWYQAHRLSDSMPLCQEFRVMPV